MGIASALATKRQRPSLLEAEIERLKDELQSVACTSSELTSLTKYGSRPHEVVVEYASYRGSGEDLVIALRLLDDAMEFLASVEAQLPERDRATLRQSQRYFVELCYTLTTLGPWCAREVAELFLKVCRRFLCFALLRFALVSLLWEVTEQLWKCYAIQRKCTSVFFFQTNYATFQKKCTEF